MGLLWSALTFFQRLITPIRLLEIQKPLTGKMVLSLVECRCRFLLVLDMLRRHSHQAKSIGGVKYIAFLEAALAAAFLTCSCAQRQSPLAPSVSTYGITAYNPPQGDPAVFRDVNIYGPGAVIRTRTAGYEAGASALVGRDAVVKWAKEPAANSAPFALPNFTGSSGYGLVAEGSSVTSTNFIYQLKGKLDSQRKTSMTVTFGDTRVLNPLGEEDLRRMVREHRRDFDPETANNLKHQTSAIVLQSYYTSSVTYSFTQDGKTNLDLSTALTKSDLAKLSANGFKITNNNLVLNKPIFIGYAPLPNPTALITRR